MTNGWEIAGTFADSFAGAGALAAVGVAVWTLWRQDDSERRRQATRVIMRVGLEAAEERTGPRAGAGETGPVKSALRVKNHSDLPVFQVHLRKPLDSESQIAWVLAWVLEPGEEVTESLDDGREHDAFAIDFMDAANRRWWRQVDGRLVPYRHRYGRQRWCRRKPRKSKTEGFWMTEIDQR